MKLVRVSAIMAIVLAGFTFVLHGAEPATKPATTAPTIKVWDGYLKSHEQFKARAKEGNIGLLFLGDSITYAWAGNGKPIWDKEFAPLQAADFGIGSDKVEFLEWRISDGELDGITPKVVVLLIGTNNIGKDPKTVKSVVDGITTILGTIHTKLPKTKVLLMGIFPRAKPTDPPEMMEHIKQVNVELAKMDDGKTLRFVDLAEQFAPNGTQNKELFVDGVHLSPKGFQVWADGIVPVLKTMME